MSTNNSDDRRVSSVAKFFANAKEAVTNTILLLRVMSTPAPGLARPVPGLPWPLSWLDAHAQKRQAARMASAVRRSMPPKAGTEPAEARVRRTVPPAAPSWEHEKQVCTVRIKWHHEAGAAEPLFIASAEDACAVAAGIFAELDCDQEHFMLLALDGTGSLTGYKVVASGMQHAVDVDVGKFFRSAMHLGASYVIAVHNHPSGRVLPSMQDLRLTRKLAHTGDIIGICLLEHIIWSPRAWLPLKELHAELFMVPGYPRA